MGERSETSVDRERHRTLTPRLTRSAPDPSLTGRVWRSAKRAVNGALSLAGLRLTTSRPPESRDFDCRLLDPETRELWIARVVAELAAFAERAGLESEAIASSVAEYLELAPRFRVRQRGGGMGFLGGLKLFVVTRMVRPTTIVESGVWRGFTTEVLHHASAPGARLLSFDINLDRVEYRSPKQSLFEADWTERIDELDVDPATCLAVFDDHVDQALRLRQAASRGLRNLVFDDDLDVTELHVDGWPGVPTATMVVNPWCRSHESTTWSHEGATFRATWSGEELAATAELVERHVPLPSLHEASGFQPGSKLSFVRLHPPTR